MHHISLLSESGNGGRVYSPILLSCRLPVLLFCAFCLGINSFFSLVGRRFDLAMRGKHFAISAIWPLLP